MVSLPRRPKPRTGGGMMTPQERFKKRRPKPRTGGGMMTPQERFKKRQPRRPVPRPRRR